MSRELESLFEAKASSLLGTFLSGNSSSGFRIPIYQRAYTWDTSHIERLLQDVLSGIEAIAISSTRGQKASQGFRFLGTVIFVDEGKNKESGFDGNSLEVVDGQQRLTTLALLACQCCERARQLQSKLVSESPAQSWLRAELKSVQKHVLKALAIRDDMASGKNAFVPRLVREGEDERSTIKKPVYKSIIAMYLHEFVHHSYHGSQSSNWSFSFGSGDEAVYFQDRINLIYKKVNKLDAESEDLFAWQKLSPVQILDNQNLRGLFQTEAPHEAFLDLKNSLRESDSQDEDDAVRTIIFSNFVLNRIVLTRVVVQEREYAYDIFEALNTSGEPLTALETFKPVLVREVGEGWGESPVSQNLDDIEDWVNSAKNNTEQKRRSQDLVIDSRVYTEGLKLSRHLRDQRDFLRTAIDKLPRKSGAEKFTDTLVSLKEYRRKYWDQKSIVNNLTDPALTERQAVAAVLVLIKASRSSLANPILCRYWDYAQRMGDPSIFSAAVKALGAFIVFRRSVTTTTANIDKDFRDLMRKGALDGKEPVGTGLDPWIDDPPEVSSLKSHLRGYLCQKRVSLDSKRAWVSKVIHSPLYETSKDIAKFILLASTHDSVVDDKKPYLMKKGKPNSNPVLSYDGWFHDVCETVEHIAPQNPKSAAEWDKRIYQDSIIRHTLGNLVLVPSAENNELANANWKIKRLYFEAFSCPDKAKIDQIIKKAKENHTPFSKKAALLLKSGAFNFMAGPIGSVEEFDADVIQERSENIANLAWEELHKWLSF